MTSLTRLARRVRVAASLPDTWLQVGCALVVLFCSVQILLYPYGRDHGIFATVGEGILHGKVPYLDLWDFKPPGIFFLFAFAQWVFGAHMASIRLLEVGALLANAYFLVVLSRRYFADSRPGFMAAALGAWVHAQLEFWHTAQPEAFAGTLTLAALCIATGFDTMQRRGLLRIAMGVLFGAVALLKPPLAGPAALCLAYEVRRADERTSLARGVLSASVPLVLGGVLPIAACLAWLVAHDAGPMLDWTFRQFTPGYTRLGWDRSALAALYSAAESAFVRMSALFAVGSIAAIGGTRSSTREVEGLTTLLGVVILQLVGVAMQAKFFEYHFAATLPPIALIAGLGFFKVWRHLRSGGGGGAVAFVCLVVACGAARRPVTDVPEGYWVRSWERLKYLVHVGDITTREQLDRRFSFVADYNLSSDLSLAHRLQALSDESDRIYIWGFEPMVYWASQRAPASRFIYNVAQRSPWQQSHARELLMSDLSEGRPRLIVVQHGDYFRFVTGDNDDSAAALEHFPELRQLIETDYSRIEQLDDFEIYRRRDDAPSAARSGQPSR